MQTNEPTIRINNILVNIDLYKEALMNNNLVYSSTHLDKCKETCTTVHHHITWGKILFTNRTMSADFVTNISPLWNYNNGQVLSFLEAWLYKAIFVNPVNPWLSCRSMGCKPHVCSLEARPKHVTKVCFAHAATAEVEDKMPDFFFFFMTLYR